MNCYNFHKMNNETPEPNHSVISPSNSIPTTPIISRPPTSPETTQPKSSNDGATKRLLIALGLGFGMFIMIGLLVFAAMQANSAKNATRELVTLKVKDNNVKQQLAQRKVTTGEEDIDDASFQAVFLKSKQVYFGKITKLTETQLTLEDIFYLKTATSAADPTNPGADVSLVKLGDELHGPQDVMYIERKEVEFWENLKSSSQVSKAIEQYQKKN